MRKLCIHCRHFRTGSCWHPSNAPLSLVDGMTRPQHSAEYLRQLHGEGYVKCEPQALWFEPVEEKPDEPNVTFGQSISTGPGDLDVCGRELKPGS